MRRSISRLALLAAMLAAVAAPHSSPSQPTTDDVAARTLLATNLADAIMNPPKGEDTEFFLRSGGVPNVFFLMDSSGSMERLPPNGPAFYGSANPTMPPGIVLANPSSPPAVTNTRTVGCGLDPVSAGNPAFAQNEEFVHINGRKFYPPCGEALDPTVVGTTYRGHYGLVATGTDYAQQSSKCPYFEPSGITTGTPGYDPKFYDPSPTAQKVPTTLWVKDYVYHESVYDDGPNGPTDRDWHRSSSALGHNFGNGWTARTAPATGFPYQTSGGAYATIETFCAEQGTAALANGQIPRDVCKTCLSTAGWYYDGFILQRTQEGIANKQYPSIWYTGNYLNFFPPKFVTMRKIVKDVIATQSKIRMALATLSTEGMALADDFNPTCAHPESNFDSNRTTYVNSVDAITFQGSAPLASALFDIGRYYHSPDLPWFGKSWEKPNTGSVTWESSSNSNDYAICYSCQTSSVIVLTGALPVAADGTSLPTGTASLADAQAGKYAGDGTTGLLPSGPNSGGVSTTDCPQCAAFSGADDYKNNLSRVSWYMHSYDLRDNGEPTKDCQKNGGRQTLDIYTVGYSTRQLGDASTILANAAAAGGGLFVAAENPSSLKQGIITVLKEIDGRSTSFSVATVSTLQTSTGHSVIVPRFDPSKAPFWKGHLYRYELYSEFVNECDPASTSNDPLCCSPNGKGDLDCDGKCVSVFLQDAGDPPGHLDPFFVQEGGDGFFYRNSPNTASCAQAPKCAAAGKSCGDISSALAKPWWDAGESLRKTAWRDRKVFTVVDSNHDGRIDHNDANLPLDSSTDAAAKILPYLGNSDNRVCDLVANKIETAGDPITAAVVRTNEVECARSIVRWVLGADVFNESVRKATDPDYPWPPPPSGPGPATLGDLTAVPPIAPNLPNQEKLGDRPFKLGDVFHSSPVVIDPPLPRLGILCRLGLHNQCLQALWRTTESETDDLEYDRYTDNYRHRRKVVLVGSNDGLVHAFNGGEWHAGEKDPYVKGIDTSQWPFGGYYDRGGPTGSDKLWAEELWAFLPPDMIAKLPLVLAGEHQMLVDGSAMVRDIWADGSKNGMVDTGKKDDLKQGPEFHTIAVFGERRGGTHYFALDVSDATWLPVGDTKPHQFPKFRWIFPQPDSRESLTTGETYTDFLPTPPPVGPVRVSAEATSAAASPYGGKQAGTPTFNGVAFHEVWVAMLSGGFDQQYVRGRGVPQVDPRSGDEIIDFSYDPSDDVRSSLRYPIPATVGMVMWGADSRRENGLGYANSGFFDTATFGDTGGQLWVLRFHEPGEYDSDGKIKSWFGARAFQMGDKTTNALSRSQPFFYITANTALPSSYIYRAYIGSGDRYNLLDQNGGVCAPDNIRACAMRGCTVSVDLASNYGTTPELGRVSGSLSEAGTGALTTGAAFDPTGGNAVQTRAAITVSACPSPSTNNGPTGFTKDVTVTCAKDAIGRWGCPSPATPLYGDALDLSNSSNAPVTRNWYFSVRIFDDLPNARIPFTTAAEAKLYDEKRLWIKDSGASVAPTQSGGVSGGFTIIPASVPNPTVPVDPSATAGWAIYYDHGPTAVDVANGNTYNVNALDERTSSVGALSSFLTWNTIQPSSGVSSPSGGACFVSKCTGEDRRVAYHYGAHPITGGSVLKDDSGNPIRAIVGNTLVPAQGDQPTVFINKKGNVLVAGTVVNPEKGASVIGADAATDAVTELGWIEVSEPTHACRHASSAPAAGVCR
jgi:type IV pilus assembly protein PilY1